MSYNSLILKKINADQYLANILDNSVKETGRLALEQAHRIKDGFTRLTWYSSCFFDNYQDVCSTLKNEDLRFSKAILNIIKNPKIILEMINVCVEYFIGWLSDDKMILINRELAKLGAHFSASTFSSRSFAYSISSAIYFSFGMKAVISGALTRFSVTSATFMGIYSWVNEAARAANWLKMRYRSCYEALYALDIEMLYFLIEHKLNSSFSKDDYSSTDARQIAKKIMELAI